MRWHRAEGARKITHTSGLEQLLQLRHQLDQKRKSMMKKIPTILTLSLAAVFVTFSQQGRSQGTSEEFDIDDVKTISGTITNVDHPRATLKAADGKEYEIHLGPYWFWQRHQYALEKGAKVEAKGETEDVKGTMQIYPWQIREGKNVITLANDDGVPEWAGRRNSRGGTYGWGKGGFGYRGQRERCCGCNRGRW